MRLIIPYLYVVGLSLDIMLYHILFYALFNTCCVHAQVIYVGCVWCLTLCFQAVISGCAVPQCLPYSCLICYISSIVFLSFLLTISTFHYPVYDYFYISLSCVWLSLLCSSYHSIMLYQSLVCCFYNPILSKLGIVCFTVLSSSTYFIILFIEFGGLSCLLLLGLPDGGCGVTNIMGWLLLVLPNRGYGVTNKMGLLYIYTFTLCCFVVFSLYTLYSLYFTLPPYACTQPCFVYRLFVHFGLAWCPIDPIITCIHTFLCFYVPYILH